MKKNIIRSFDKAAKHYDTYAVLQRNVADKLLKKIVINSNDFVLDGGCGTGYLHELLRKNKIYCPLMQFDISYKMCEIAKLYAAPKEYGTTYNCVGDLEQVPFNKESFDIVFSSLTLQWANNLSQAIKQIKEVTKNGGIVAISLLGEKSLYELKEAFLELDDLTHVNDNLLTEEYVRNVLSENDFKNINIESEIIVKEHKNFKDMIGSIKYVGASYKPKGHKKYLGRDYFKQLEEIYRDKFMNNKGLLPLSWEIIYVKASL